MKNSYSKYQNNRSNLIVFNFVWDKILFSFTVRISHMRLITDMELRRFRLSKSIQIGVDQTPFSSIKLTCLFLSTKFCPPSSFSSYQFRTSSSPILAFPVFFCFSIFIIMITCLYNCSWFCSPHMSQRFYFLPFNSLYFVHSPNSCSTSPFLLILYS